MNQRETERQSSGAGNWCKVRRGLLDHMRTGRLTLREAGALCAIILQANPANGVWFGSPAAMRALCGAGDLNARQARRVLDALEEKGYIRRWAGKGKRGNYPILVDRFECQVGGNVVGRINALESASWKSPRIEGGRGGGRGEGHPYKEVNREGRERTTEKPPLPPLPARGEKSEGEGESVNAVPPESADGFARRGLMVGNVVVCVWVPRNVRRLLTETEKAALVGSRAEGYVEFFRASKGWRAEVMKNAE